MINSLFVALAFLVSTNLSFAYEATAKGPLEQFNPTISAGPVKLLSCNWPDLKNNEKTIEQVEAAINEEFLIYLSLVEKSLSYRYETIKTAAELKEKIARGEPLSGEDLDKLNYGTVAHLKLRSQLFAFAEAHECWVKGTDDYFNSLGIQPAVRLKGVMLSISAALALYDNYLLAVSIFEEDVKLRILLNKRDSGYDKGMAELSRIRVSYDSAYNRHRVRRAIGFYEKELKKMPPSFLENDDAAYLNLLISQSPSYNMTKKFSPLYVVGRKLQFLSSVTVDTMKGLSREGVNIFSMTFGNTMGLVESRKGKLYEREEIERELINTLSAGDILLEKTPFRLTDKFIPGHWGHAAVWVGTEKELKELGIWEHPVVAKHWDKMRAGRSVVEALRSGVEMNTIKHFLNVDDVAVLRKKDMTREERAATILLVLRQVRKEYDFNFDVETTDRIVCSELVYTTFVSIKWPTERTLGRMTISPDNVADKALGSGPLDLVLFCHDGKMIIDDPLVLMKRLMGKEVTVAIIYCPWNSL